jgi:hypothetical protein
MGTRGRVEIVLGSSFIVVGIATWAVALAVFEPALSSFFHSWADVGGRYYAQLDADPIEFLYAYGKWLRWASIALGIAGVLLLLRRSRWRGRLAWGLAVAWIGVDVMLDRLDVSGSLVAIVAAVVGCGVVAAVVVVGRRYDGELPPYRWSATVYSGALLGSALWTALPGGPELRPHVPAGLIGCGQVLTVALAIAGVVTAATSTAEISRNRMIAAGASVAVVAVLVLVDVGLQSDPGSAHALIPVLIPGLFGGLPLVLALLAGRVSRGRGVVALLTAPLIAMLAIYPVVVLSMAGASGAGLTGDSPEWQTVNPAAGGFIVGAQLGLLALALQRTSPRPVSDTVGWLPIT